MKHLSSQSIAIAQIFWMMIGPAILLILAVGIARDDSGWLTIKDIWFMLVLAVLILARSLEFHGENPRTATGEPATAADLRKYIRVAMVGGIAVWIFANLLGNYWLTN